MQINICKVNIMKILLISNMYPSAKDKTYGTFVKMFKEGSSEIQMIFFLIVVLFEGVLIILWLKYISILYSILL